MRLSGFWNLEVADRLDGFRVFIGDSTNLDGNGNDKGYLSTRSNQKIDLWSVSCGSCGGFRVWKSRAIHLWCAMLHNGEYFELCEVERYPSGRLLLPSNGLMGTLFMVQQFHRYGLHRTSNVVWQLRRRRYTRRFTSTLAHSFQAFFSCIKKRILILIQS